jgi:hypothetical protein
MIERDMPEAVYHRRPELSQSQAKTVLECPARYLWEFDNPATPTDAMVLGSAVHSLVLGGPSVIEVQADSWRSKDAREARIEADSNGMIPLLSKDYEKAVTMADAAMDTRMFDDGETELSLVHGDLRGRVDLLNGSLIVDLKTTVSADPERFGRTAVDYGYHMQAAWYIDLVRALDLARAPQFVFVLVEKTAPYLTSIVELDDDAIRIGRERNAAAIEIWRECQTLDDWPGYGSTLHTVSLPQWAVVQHEREIASWL